MRRELDALAAIEHELLGLHNGRISKKPVGATRLQLNPWRSPAFENGTPYDQGVNRCYRTHSELPLDTA